jgi:hypothetical protein
MIKVAALALALATLTSNQFPKDAYLTRVSCETAESIVFEMSVTKKTYAADEDIDVNYVVRNKSRRTVYLVTKPSEEVRIPDTWIAVLPVPLDDPDPHYPYLNKLQKISPGKTFSGKRTIKAKTLEDHPKYAFDVVEIQAGFAYLFDITGLEDCDADSSRSYVCKMEIPQRAQVLNLGTVVVRRNTE